jgi:hypothetical protein
VTARVVRNERSRDGKSRMLSVWSWAPDDAPALEEKLLLNRASLSGNAAGYAPLTERIYARGRREMAVMP